MHQSIRAQDYKLIVKNHGVGNPSDQETLKNSILIALQIAHLLINKQMGNYMGIERLVPKGQTPIFPPEIAQYVSGFADAKRAIVASYGHFDNDPLCVMLDIIFECSVSAIARPDGSIAIPDCPVYRVYGNEWSIMFRTSFITNSRGLASSGKKFMKEYSHSPVDISLHGNVNSFESDMLMYRLMGLQQLEENQCL